MLDSLSIGRRVTYTIVLLLAVLMVTLILSELVLRMSGRVSTESIRVASDPTYDRIPGVFEPWQKVTERPRPELIHHISINSLGFRGTEISVGKNPNSVRILCIGDSVTFGSFVNNEDTFPAQLGEKLAHEGVSVEAVNGGVGGSTIIDQKNFLRKALVIKPDIVVLTFSENDIDDLNKRVPIHITMASNRKLKSGIAGFVYRSVRDTALFNFILLAKAWYSDIATPRAIAQGNIPNVEADNLWQSYETELREMADFLRAHSIHFLFAVFPSDHRIGKPLSPGNRLERVHRLAERNGIRTIDLLAPLEKSQLKSTELYLLPYDGHPSRRAYEIVAQAMAAAIHSEHLIERVVSSQKSPPFNISQPVERPKSLPHDMD